jgi:hypothetical protein
MVAATSPLRESLEFLLGLVACFAVPALAVATLLAVLNLTLGPLLRAARRGTRPNRYLFLLSDLWWLLIQLQLAMGLSVYALPADMGTQQRLIMMVVFCLPVPIFWSASLLAVSQAQIYQPRRRATVFLVLVPGLVLGLAAVPLLLVALFSQPAWGLAAMAGLVVGLFALRWLAAWAVKCESPWREMLLVPLIQQRLAAPPLSQSLIEQHRGGGGDVEAVHGAEHRKTDGGNIAGPPQVG